MWTESRIRRCGTVAVGSGSLSVLTALLMNSAWHLTDWSKEGDVVVSQGFWEPALRTLAGPLLSFAAPEAMYNTYGRLVALLFVGLFVGTLGLRAHLTREASGDGRLATVRRWAAATVVIGTGLLPAGSITEYWVGYLPGFEPMISNGFFLSVLGTLVLAVGYPVLGAAGLRTQPPPRWLSWAFLLWLPVAVGLGAVGFTNIPANPGLTIGLLSLLFGVYLRRSPSPD